MDRCIQGHFVQIRDSVNAMRPSPESKDLLTGEVKNMVVIPS